MDFSALSDIHDDHYSRAGVHMSLGTWDSASSFLQGMRFLHGRGSENK